tara:strand:- start:304 stop:513 length:210 start_codon:yes stop_codon:yes gene_type:complete
MKETINMVDFAESLFGFEKETDNQKKSRAEFECTNFAKKIEEQFGVVVFFNVYTQDELNEQAGETNENK